MWRCFNIAKSIFFLHSAISERKQLLLQFCFGLGLSLQRFKHMLISVPQLVCIC